MKLPGLPTCSLSTSYFFLATILTVKHVHGNAVSSDCVKGLQTTCAEEITSLEERHGREACGYLSKAISCLSCKLPNCSEIAANIVQTYVAPPYSCHLEPDDVILLQKGDDSVKLCLLLQPTTTTTTPPDNEPQVQDKGNANNTDATQPNGPKSVRIICRPRLIPFGFLQWTRCIFFKLLRLGGLLASPDSVGTKPTANPTFCK